MPEFNTLPEQVPPRSLPREKVSPRVVRVIEYRVRGVSCTAAKSSAPQNTASITSERISNHHRLFRVESSNFSHCRWIFMPEKGREIRVNTAAKLSKCQIIARYRD